MSIRKPQNYSEEKRVEELDRPLGVLSLMVNAYEATEFKGKLANTIKLEEGEIVLGGMFLDNDNIAILAYKDDGLKLNIHNRLSRDLISSTIVKSDSEGSIMTSQNNMAITPNRNILINYQTHDKSAKLGGKFLLYNQEGVLLWERTHNNIGEIVLLNDDTILLREKNSVILLYRDDEKVLSSKKDSNLFGQFHSTIVPYCRKGFICYTTTQIFLYNDNLEEKKILEIDNELEITALEVVNSDTIIYGTSGRNLVMYDMKEEKEIFNDTLAGDGLRIRKIKLLPHKRCLVILNPNRYAENGNTIRILNIDNPGALLEKEYHSPEYCNYIGISSGGHALFTVGFQSGNLVVVYDILNKKGIKYNIGILDVSGFSSFDSIIARSNEVSDQVSIFE
jgi:hypothetical protein